MHRVTDDRNYQDPPASGIRRYINQNLPSEAGTKVQGCDLNAIQEELCNIITLNGGTVVGDGDANRATACADDKTAGWRQLYDTIFESGNIGDDAITDDSLSLTKLTFPAVRSDSGDSISIDVDTLTMSGTGGDSGVLTPNSLLMTHLLGATCLMTGRGLRYNNGPGDNAFKSMNLRKAGFDVDETATPITWTSVGSGSTGIWSAGSFAVLTDIPQDCGVRGVVGAWVQSTGTAAGDYICPATVTVEWSGGYLRLSSLSVHSGYPVLDPGDEFRLIVEFDATALVVP